MSFQKLFVECYTSDPTMDPQFVRRSECDQIFNNLHQGDDAHFNFIKNLLSENSTENINNFNELAMKNFKEKIENDGRKPYVHLHTEFGLLFNFCTAILKKQLETLDDFHQIEDLIKPKLDVLAKLVFAQVDEHIYRYNFNDITQFGESIKNSVKASIIAIVSQSLQMKEEHVLSSNFIFSHCVLKMLDFMRIIGISPGALINEVEFNKLPKDVKKRANSLLKKFNRNSQTPH